MRSVAAGAGMAAVRTSKSGSGSATVAAKVEAARAAYTAKRTVAKADPKKTLLFLLTCCARLDLMAYGCLLCASTS